MFVPEVPNFLELARSQSALGQLSRNDVVGGLLANSDFEVERYALPSNFRLGLVRHLTHFIILFDTAWDLYVCIFTGMSKYN